MKNSLYILVLFAWLNGMSQNAEVKRILYAGMISESPGEKGKAELRTIDEVFKRSSLFDEKIRDIKFKAFEQNDLWNFDFYVQGRVVGTLGVDSVLLSVYKLFPDTRSKALIECSREYRYIVSPASNVKSWTENVLRDVLYLKNVGQMRDYVYMTHSIAANKQSLRQSLERLPKRLNQDPEVMPVAFFLSGEKDEYSFVKSDMKPDMSKLFITAKKGESGRTKNYPVSCAAAEEQVCDEVYGIIVKHFRK